MTATPTPRPSFGRALAEATRKIGKLHRRALADFDTDFPGWMLLTLLHEQTAPLPVGDVVAEMDRRMDLAAPDVLGVLERLAAAGLVAHRPEDPAAALTAAGSAHFTALYAHARKRTDAATDGIDPEQLDSANTVLLAADARATSLLQA